MVGQGVNNCELKMYGFIRSEQRQSFEYIVHSKFLLTLAETGLVGLTALVCLFVVTSRRAFNLARRGLSLGAGLLCSMIVVVLNMNAEGYEAISVLLNQWILIAIVAALWSSEKATPFAVSL